MKEVLVCPPLYFDVTHCLNTRMRPDHPAGRPDKKLIMDQWSKMVGVLHHDLGVKSIFVDPEPGLEDMVFICDPGLWVDDLFIRSNFQVEERRREASILESWFYRRLDWTKSLAGDDAYFEGGDCVMVGDTLILGYGDNRTNERGVEEVKKILEPRGVKVLPIWRVTEEFYHLNSVLTVYPSARAIVFYAPAFEVDANKKLHDAFASKGYRIFELGRRAVYRYHPAIKDENGRPEYLYSYCLNSFENNGKVLMSYCSDQHFELLQTLGLTPMVVDSSELEKSGGSWRCSLMIHN